MAGKWKYKPLKQKDEKEEEETLLIGDPSFGQFGDGDQRSNHFSNHFRQPSNPNSHFNLPTNHHPNNHPNNHQPRNPFNNLENHHDLNDPKFELKQRGNNGAAARPQATSKDDAIELVEYCIKPNDSLLSISLSCNCSVEELKRVNRLINDQEFYGLRFIKIPVRKYGLLSEVLIHQFNKTSQPISLEEIKASLTNHQQNHQQNTPGHRNLTSDPTNLNRNLSSQNLAALNQHNTLSSSRSANNLLASSLADGQPIGQSIGQQQPLINFNDEAYPPVSHPSTSNLPNSNLPNSPAFKPDSLLQSPDAASSRSSSTNSLIVNVGLKKTFDYDRNDGDLNKFLSSLDRDLDKMRKLTTSTPSIVEPLTSEDLLILNSQSEVKSSDCDGASCGLTTRSVFLIAIFIFVLAPLIYFAIYAENESFSHLNHHLNHH